MIISLPRPSFTLHSQVLHSYGGIVGTEAVHESLGKHARHGKGLSGGVVALLYMTAFVLAKGGSLASARGEPPPYLTIKVGRNALSYFTEIFRAVLLGILSLQSAAVLQAPCFCLINLCALDCPHVQARVCLLWAIQAVDAVSYHTP